LKSSSFRDFRSPAEAEAGKPFAVSCKWYALSIFTITQSTQRDNIFRRLCYPAINALKVMKPLS
ncbi:hypothetical protein E4U57_004155, partial [Claviceps arundinis]